MEALDVHRLQFAFTITYHYLFPQITMGLALLLVVFKVRELRGDEASGRALRFWAKIFGVCFAMGVVTGIPMEFQFGTNWARFSERTGNLIGQTLAMEGVFAFFLEATFLYFLLYGEKLVGPRGHLAAAVMVFLGSWLSGYFIVCTNAWMQHPVGHTIASDGTIELRSIGALLTNPWAVRQYAHTMVGSVITASFVTAGIGAFWTLRGVHTAVARRSLVLGVSIGFVASILAAAPTGSLQAEFVHEHQPATFAAMEGHFHTEDGAAMTLIGQPNMDTLTLDNPIRVPGMLSFLTYQRWDAEVPGLVEYPRDEWPDNVPLLYFSYHIMAGLGTLFIALLTLAAYLAWRGTLHRSRLVLWALMLAVPFPFIANTAGWLTAELGRQPWIVHGLMRTEEGHSLNVSTGNVWFSLLGFAGLYSLLSVLFVALMLRLIARGPAPAPDAIADESQGGGLMLPVVWFWLLALMLATYVVLGGTDLGVGMLLTRVARTPEERRKVIETIRPLWKPNEVWLVAAGGTLFLAFPKLLAVAFSGFYLPLMLVLWLLLARGLAIELRYQLDDDLWRGLWDTTLGIASALLVLCFGAALGNILRGVPLDEDGSFFTALWTNFRVSDRPGVLDWYTVLVAIVALLALAHHGALWLASRADGDVRERAALYARRLLPAVLLTWVALGALSFEVRPGVLESLRAHRWGIAFPALAVAGFLASARLLHTGRAREAYLASCVALYAGFLTAAVSTFPDVLPARDPAHSLTLATAAAPDNSLATALWWWVPGMAIVVGCFAWMHRRIGR